MDVRISRLLFPKKKYGDVIAFFDVTINDKVIKNFRIVKSPDKKFQDKSSKIKKPVAGSYIITADMKIEIETKLKEKIKNINQQGAKKAENNRKKTCKVTQVVPKIKKMKYYSGYWDSDPKKTQGKRNPTVKKSNWKAEVSKGYLPNRFNW